MRCKKVTYAGAVLEVEVFTVSDKVRNIKNAIPKPENNLTPEQKAQKNVNKSQKQFIRLVNTNFTSRAYYITLTYKDEYYPNNYEQAIKDRNNYLRRLKYHNPNVRYIAVTGYGSITGRLHHHLIVDGAGENDILQLWTCGDIARAEHLREHNYYNGVDYGEDYTALACYLHEHTPKSYNKRRWLQSKNIL